MRIYPPPSTVGEEIQARQEFADVVKEICGPPPSNEIQKAYMKFVAKNGFHCSVSPTYFKNKPFRKLLVVMFQWYREKKIPSFKIIIDEKVTGAVLRKP